MIEPQEVISLAQLGSLTGPIDVTRRASYGVQIVAAAWGQAMLEAKWSNDNESFFSFAPPIYFHRGAQGRNRVDTTNIRSMRLETISADATGSDSAEIFVMPGLQVPVTPFPHSTHGLLAQITPDTTSDVLLYQPAFGVETTIQSIVVCYSTIPNSTYSLYHDANGTSYSVLTAIVQDAVIAANSFVQFEIAGGIPVNHLGSIGCASGNADDITFSVYGHERFV